MGKAIANVGAAALYLVRLLLRHEVLQQRFIGSTCRGEVTQQIRLHGDATKRLVRLTKRRRQRHGAALCQSPAPKLDPRSQHTFSLCREATSVAWLDLSARFSSASFSNCCDMTMYSSAAALATTTAHVIVQRRPHVQRSTRTHESQRSGDTE